MIPTWAWLVTLALIGALFLYDYFFHVRVAHTPTLKEASIWSAVFIAIALAFGGFVWLAFGPQRGMEYFAGYITEKALSVDNLFVFLLIMSGFKVPRADQQKVLLFGILFSILARAGFIFVGAALLETFAWMFYLFGGLLIMMAGKQLAPEGKEDDSLDGNLMVRVARKLFHTTDHYDGDRLFTTLADGRRAMTPMLLVMAAIGGTDILFALDSIPAIFGLTNSTFIVFTATAFSLMGLRQLYFLIDGLLDRLVYLKYGLATILAFIGIKLVLHALHENNVPFINNGQPVEVVEITTALSLTVICAVLVVTVIASLLSPKGKALTVIRNARRHAAEYLDLGFEADAAQRELNYRQLLREEAELASVRPEFRHLIHDEQRLLDMLDEAHRVHGDYIDRHPERYQGQDPMARATRLDTDLYRQVFDTPSASKDAPDASPRA